MFVIFIFTIPLLFEGFESGSIPQNWKIGNGGNPNYTWSVTQYGTHWPFEPEPEGNYYVICDSTTNPVLFDDTLYSPSVFIPSQGLIDIALSLKVFFARDSGSTTRGYVMIKKFINSSWSPWEIIKIYGEGSDSLIYWGDDSINIYSYVANAESLKLAFRYYRNDSIYWFILDAIKINALYSLIGDAGVTSIISPRHFFKPNIPCPVRVEVCNFSPSQLYFWTKCKILDSLTGTLVYKDSLPVLINANSKDTVDFSPFIGSPEKSYFVISWTEAQGDPNHSNDTAYAYATTRPYFGAIIDEFYLPRSDSLFYDLTFNSNDTSLYIIYQKDSVFRLNLSGLPLSLYSIVDFSSGNIVDIPFGIFYDKESNSFWVTQIGISAGSPNWCYAVNYSSSFNFISKFDLKQKGFVAYNLSDAYGLNKGWLPKAVFPNKYYIYLLNFSDTLNPVIDSIVYSYPIFLIAGAIDAIGDSIFLLTGFGNNKIFMLNKMGNILGECEFEAPVRGIAVERIKLQEYIYAYLNIGGYKILKISTGLKWINVKEKENKENRFILFAPFNQQKINIFYPKEKGILRIYDTTGRIYKSFLLKKGINYIKVKNFKPGVYFLKIDREFKGKIIMK